MTAINANFIKRYFRRVNNVVWDLTTGKTGIQTSNGIASFDLTPAKDATATEPAVPASGQISINPIDSFGYTLPAFALATPFEKVEPGDLIHGADSLLGWVVEKTAAALKIHKADGHTTTYVPPKVNLVGSGDNSVQVVKSLTSMLGGGEAVSNLNNSLLPLLLLGDGFSGKEDLIPLLLMGNSNGNVNPLLMLSLLKGNSGGAGGLFDDPLMLMMMTGGLGNLGGGSGGFNPMMLALLANNRGANSASIPGISRTSRPALTRL